MVTIKDLKKLIEGMGRPRKDFIKKFDGITDDLEYNLWKIFAYHKYRPEDVRHWLSKVNGYIEVIKIYNASKKGKGFNIKKKELKTRITDYYFGTVRDIDVKIGIFSDKGFPIVKVTKEDHKKLKQFSNKVVDLIFEDKGLLKLNLKELL